MKFDLAPVVVAIPARNEAGCIGTALAALAAQPEAGRRIAAVIVYANNCTDDTAAAARSVALPFPLHVVEATLPPPHAHIGHARRAVTDAAAAHLEQLGRPDGIIASTDADSRVARDWLARLRKAFAPDIDAVCGEIALDGPVTPRLAAVRDAEAAYAEAVAQAVAWLDPLGHDPWPRHIWSWGANLAVRARSLIAVGGSPLVDLAEDRALHDALLHNDARIRHACDVRVFTSGRADGRAPGGFADLLLGYATDPAALADFYLEPAAISWHRAQSRGYARDRWRGPGSERPGFGACWAEREAAAPALARQRVEIAALPAQTMLLRARLKAAAGRFDNQQLSIATRSRPQAASRR
jgi:cellulose synthase/poly-beta-1,6-N-acetylglucosamine synthase-like glycosyltransferase